MRAQRQGSREGGRGRRLRGASAATTLACLMVGVAGAGPILAAPAVEDRPTDRNEAWSGFEPDHDLGPDRNSILLSDALLADYWRAAAQPHHLPLPPAQLASEPDQTIEPHKAPLPTAGWAGLLLLLGMATWRGVHLRHASRM